MPALTLTQDVPATHPDDAALEGHVGPEATAEAQRQRFAQQALRHVGSLRAAARRYVPRQGADAEDLVQETLLRAFIAWDRFRPDTDCRAWLLKILSNSFINNYRRSIRERRLAHQEDPLISPRRRRAATQPESIMMERLLADEVLEALDALPAEFREVVMLADLAGASYRNIAAEIDIPVGTVMSRLHRGRRLLQSRLHDYARKQGIGKQAA